MRFSVTSFASVTDGEAEGVPWLAHEQHLSGDVAGESQHFSYRPNRRNNTESAPVYAFVHQIAGPALFGFESERAALQHTKVCSRGSCLESLWQ